MANHLAAPLARCARSTFKAGPRARSDGVSRLSAHLHFGMVSPFRVAREALAAGTYSANKFVDEFLTWREVAYAFCFHHSGDLETLQARRPPAARRLWRRALRTSCQAGLAWPASACSLPFTVLYVLVSERGDRAHST